MSLLWLFVVLVVSVLLHELGHALAAWAGGYVVTSFGIGSSGKPLLRVRLPRSGTVFYVCRFGLRFSGVTWVFHPKGISSPSRLSDLLLACGGSLTNAILALGAGWLLASFELRSVSFLRVWVPTVVTLLVNSVLALLFFVPHRTLSASQGTLASDGLRALALLFPSSFRNGQPGSVVPSLRTLAEKRLFWESIGDTTMLCVALIRAAEAYRELGDRDAARACWQEVLALPVTRAAALYQRAWSSLLTVRLKESANPTVSLNEAEAAFRAIGNRTGDLMVARERLMLAPPTPDRDVSLARLQTEAAACGDAPLALSLVADRIHLPETPQADLERLASQYDAARLGLESSVYDVRVYGRIAAVRVAAGDDGGAAIVFERALTAARRVFIALAFLPQTQSRFAARQAPLVSAAIECSRRLEREADAARYARLLA